MSKQIEISQTTELSQSASSKLLAVRALKFMTWDGYEWIYFDADQPDNAKEFWVDSAYIYKNRYQFTGIFDINGKEDWENDLVKVKVGNQHYIRPISRSETGAWAINLPVMSYSFIKEEPVMVITIEHENIGNIFENADLLEHR